MVLVSKLLADNRPFCALEHTVILDCNVLWVKLLEEGVVFDCIERWLWFTFYLLGCDEHCVLIKELLHCSVDLRLNSELIVEKVVYGLHKLFDSNSWFLSPIENACFLLYTFSHEIERGDLLEKRRPTWALHHWSSLFWHRGSANVMKRILLSYKDLIFQDLLNLCDREGCLSRSDTWSQALIHKMVYAERMSSFKICNSESFHF